MRKEFCAAILARASSDEKLVFLSGDLGFNALEEVQSALGPRFINAGVAEQNMMTVAAGLAASGFAPWTYSIAPFVVLRPIEQVRNDICFHGMNVKVVANGGGFAYGHLGATHHMLEDLACMSGLPNMSVYVPAFAADVAQAVADMAAAPGPSYLRLGHAADPCGHAVPRFGAFRRLLEAKVERPIVVAGIGPVLGQVLRAVEDRGDVEVWACGRLPLPALPPELGAAVARSRALVCVEDHYAHGGFGSALALALMREGTKPGRFIHRHAATYPSGKYGSQQYHLAESGLDSGTLKQLFAQTTTPS